MSVFEVLDCCSRAGRPPFTSLRAAAAKLRRAQEAAEMSRPYAERFSHVMGKLSASVGDSESAPKLLRGTGNDQTHLLVVMTAERGLCGGFNGNIAKLARAEAEKLKEAGKTVKIITVGKKGRDAINDQYIPGIFEGMWLSVTTMTTVGYGDYAPKRWSGRAVSFVIMIVGITFYVGRLPICRIL